MCRSEIIKRLGGTVKETFSCDGFPVRAAGKPQCGICTSCLLRRLSLEAAGLSCFDESEHYLTDLTGPVNRAAPSADQLNDIRAMEWQYQTLAECLSQEDPWQALIKEFPTLQTICSELAVYRNYPEDELRRNLLRLYAEYCAEWQNFSARRNFIRLGRRAA